MNLYIGSGDISSLMMDNKTKGYQDFMRKFVSDEKPNYNAFASPIDALRTGAILESNYLRTLGDNYFCQYRAVCKDMDVFVSSVDFAKIENGKIVDFDELKTIYLTDFLELIQPASLLSLDGQKEFLLKNFKKNYYQVQAQLMCANLDNANLVFLSVENYEDEENFSREIKETEVVKFRVNRDKSIIKSIKQKGKIFQLIKNNFYECK